MRSCGHVAVSIISVLSKHIQLHMHFIVALPCCEDGEFLSCFLFHSDFV